jgi:hypothetical protein
MVHPPSCAKLTVSIAPDDRLLPIFRLRTFTANKKKSQGENCSAIRPEGLLPPMSLPPEPRRMLFGSRIKNWALRAIKDECAYTIMRLDPRT